MKSDKQREHLRRIASSGGKARAALRPELRTSEAMRGIQMEREPEILKYMDHALRSYEGVNDLKRLVYHQKSKARGVQPAQLNDNVTF